MKRVAVRGRNATPVGAVYCVGRNYAAHAAEMNAPPQPLAFLKPASAVLAGGGDVSWPTGSETVHHEVEVVLLLGRGGAKLSRESARDAIHAVGVGIDLTARDLQDDAKKRGLPWARSKGFPGSAPVSEFVPLSDWGGAWPELDLVLEVDGARRQSGCAASMILDPPACVAVLSEWFELAAGDLIFTGTPEGVGPILPGQTVRAACTTLGLSVSVRLVRQLAPSPVGAGPP